MICLALTGKTLKENIETLKAHNGRIDCAELRADYLETEEFSSLKDFPALTSLPIILTVRKPSDGGFFKGTEADRAGVIAEGLSGNYRFVDLEEDFFGRIPESLLAGKTVIRSFHDFHGTEGLEKRLASLARTPCEIPKAAVMPESTRDCLRILDAARAVPGQKILIGMGSWGFFTRVLYKRLGSVLTFCSASGSAGKGTALAAPGHTDPDTLKTLYRADRVSSSTELYGVIGNPIMHSRSPEIHNKGYARLSIDAVYVPFQVDDISLFKLMMEVLDMRGVSVTIPHKETIRSILDDEDAAVTRIGACNTVIRRCGLYSGYNTDSDGFLAPLKPILSSAQAEDGKALVIGAGGAARSVVYALTRTGMGVSITNRTCEKGAALAREFGCSSLPAEEVPSGEFELIVQTTSAGMHPQEDQDPLPSYRFSGKEIVYDIVYTPPLTAFLARAQAAGCRTLGGLEMLKAQGKAQFGLFTGREYPPDLD
jgi:3-dehydroquinate dehydratase/shikimate dehydrogenase